MSEDAFRWKGVGLDDDAELEVFYNRAGGLTIAATDTFAMDSYNIEQTIQIVLSVEAVERLLAYLTRKAE